MNTVLSLPLTGSCCVIGSRPNWLPVTDHAVRHSSLHAIDGLTFGAQFTFLLFMLMPFCCWIEMVLTFDIAWECCLFVQLFQMPHCLSTSSVVYPQRYRFQSHCHKTTVACLSLATVSSLKTRLKTLLSVSWQTCDLHSSCHCLLAMSQDVCLSVCLSVSRIWSQ